MENTANTATAAEVVSEAATKLATLTGMTFEDAVMAFLKEVATVDPTRFARLMKGLEQERAAVAA